jgi:hypothetical protein
MNAWGRAATTRPDQTGAIPAITWVKIVCVKIARVRAARANAEHGVDP